LAAITSEVGRISYWPNVAEVDVGGWEQECGEIRPSFEAADQSPQAPPPQRL